MDSAGKRSVKKTALMDLKSTKKTTPQSSKKEKPLLLKKYSNGHTEMQSVLGFPCKKPVRLSPTLLPKSCSPAKTPSKTPAKPPPALDILTPERKCTRHSSATKSKSKRFAKSLKDVIDEAKKLQANTHSKKPSLSEEEEGHDEEPIQMETKTPKAADFNLPDKYAGLAEFFDAMEAAIRLLRLRKAISTFNNICPQVETMTQRRFMHSHVAQMKYILPEGLLLEKIMLHDENTLCMKADLKITLLHDALNSAKGREVFASASKVNTSVLRKTFHTRLMEFVRSHPQGVDVPEEILPEPFNKKCQLTPVKPKIVVSPPSCTPTSSPRPVHEQDAHSSIMSSLLPKSFQRRFSQRTFMPQASLNSSCIPDVTEAGKSDGSNGDVSYSGNSHFPAGFKSRFAAKFCQNEISQVSNGLKEPSKVDCSPILKFYDSTTNNASDRSETPCKVPDAKLVTKNAAEENTPCKNVLAVENTSLAMIKGCFSPTTPGIAPDASAQKTVSVVSSVHNTPAIKTLLKSGAKSSISRRSLRFENAPNSSDASTPVSPFKTNSFNSPDSSCVSKSSGQKSKISKVRRAVVYNKSNKNSCGSTICEDSSVHSAPLKRKAAEFQSTPVRIEGMESYADSAMHSPLRVAANPFLISKNDDNATNNSICPFQSPKTTLSSKNIQDEKTPDEVFLSTPPLHPPKRRRLNASELTTPLTKAAQSFSRTCPPSFQSPEKCIIEPCKADVDRESNASKQTDNGSISIQRFCSEIPDVMNQSEWEILQTLSPKLVREVHERQIKILDDCRLGVSAAKRRQQMLACLPKLFNMIRDIFRSSKRSVMTRQELVHKIISNHCDVTDRSEVEEQLQLLQELVPDWITGRTATSGDFLYSIENNIDIRSIHTKLVSAL